MNSLIFLILKIPLTAIQYTILNLCNTFLPSTGKYICVFFFFFFFIIIILNYYTKFNTIVIVLSLLHKCSKACKTLTLIELRNTFFPSNTQTIASSNIDLHSNHNMYTSYSTFQMILIPNYSSDQNVSNSLYHSCSNSHPKHNQCKKPCPLHNLSNQIHEDDNEYIMIIIHLIPG